MTRRLALLRAVNVGKRKVPMAELRALAGELGLANARTFIASGNLLFDSDEEDGRLEQRLEAALLARFGFEVPVIVRDAVRWRAHLAANPFPQEVAVRPNLILMALSKAPLVEGAAEAIEARGQGGERVRIAGGALWFDYSEAVGTSKLTPALIDRAAGSPTTARNWRSALTLGDMLEGTA